MSNDQSQTDASRKVVQNMYDSALAGDNAAFFGSLADNLLVMEPQFLPYGGKHHGVAGFQALFGMIAAYLDLASIKLDSLVADGEVVVAFLRATAVKDGSEVQIAERSIVRNGKIVEMKIYFHELGALASVIKH